MRYLISLRDNTQREIYKNSKIAIAATPGETYRYIDESSGKTPLSIHTRRHKNDLIIEDKDTESSITIERFWENCQAGDQSCQMVIDQMNGGQTIINQSNNVLHNLSQGATGSIVEPSILKQEVTWGLYKGVDLGSSILHGAATAVVAYALIHELDKKNDAPPQPIADTTPPNAPILYVKPSEGVLGQLVAYGAAEPNSTVTLIFPDGSRQTTLASTTGAFSITSTTTQNSGIVKATATDASKNTSPEARVNFTDNLPVITLMTIEDAGLGNGRINVSGITDPGTTVTLALPVRGVLGNQETMTLQANDKGVFSGISALNQGDGSVAMTLKDPAGNVAQYTYTYNDIVPAQPFTLNVAQTNGSAYTRYEDGTCGFSGRGEPGATIRFTWPTGEIATTTINALGEFSIRSTTEQPSGRISATLTDLGNNTINVPMPDYQSVPTAPLVLLMDTGRGDGKFMVVGFAEANSIVRITFPNQSDRIQNGETIELVATPDANQVNTFDTSGSIFAETVYVKGDSSFTATATNTVGTSKPKTSTFDDTIKPDVVQNFVTQSSATQKGVIDFSGNAEPWSTVVVDIGNISTTVFTDANGSFSGSTPALPEGTLASVHWTLTDIGNNTIYSPKIPSITIPIDPPAPDTTGPAVDITSVLPSPTGLNVNDHNALISINFNEDSVLDISQLVVEGGSLTQVARSGVSIAYVFTAQADYEGTARISVPNGGAKDVLGNPNTDGSDANNTLVFPIDTNAPQLNMTAAQNTLNAGQTTQLTLSFSENIGNSLSLSDFVVSGGSLDQLSQDALNPLLWHIDFTASASSPNSQSMVSLGSITVYDAAGNYNRDGLDVNNAVHFTIL